MSKAGVYKAQVLNVDDYRDRSVDRWGRGQLSRELQLDLDNPAFLNERSCILNLNSIENAEALVLFKFMVG